MRGGSGGVLVAEAVLDGDAADAAAAEAAAATEAAATAAAVCGGGVLPLAFSRPRSPALSRGAGASCPPGARSTAVLTVAPGGSLACRRASQPSGRRSRSVPAPRKGLRTPESDGDGEGPGAGPACRAGCPAGRPAAGRFDAESLPAEKGRAARRRCGKKGLPSPVWPKFSGQN